MAISCEALVSYFAGKMLLLCRDVLATIDTVCELETPWPSSWLVLDYFNQLFQDGVDRILAAVKPSTSFLDLCLLWLVKASDDEIWVSLSDIINLFLS